VHTEEVAGRLNTIAKERNISLFRISGAEPFLGKRSAEHVVKVIEMIDGKFIVETNGIMLGYYPEIVEMLKNLDACIRVTIKGRDEISFERITAPKKSFLIFNSKLLRHLAKLV
jgi:uncharacterized Fe-S cluster-containing radical SAM superfamily protein